MARLKNSPLPAAPDKARAVREMFDKIAPRYDLVNRVMTFGLDQSWRRRTVEKLALPVGSVVADVACGTGDLCFALHRLGLHPVGVDFSVQMLARARRRGPRLPLIGADGTRLPLRHGSVDGVTCGFALRNVTDLTALLTEFARVLRGGGRVSILEVSEPSSPLLRIGHRAYFHKVVPMIGGLLSDRGAYRYLPASTSYLPHPQALIEMMQACGFTAVTRQSVGLGAAQILAGTKV